MCIALFGIFLTVFMNRMGYYQEYAEKMAMELTVENVRTGLRYRVANLILANRMREVSALADENPINWLAERPDNYLGEFDGLPPGDTAGKWYFDRRARELVYGVNNRRHFASLGGPDAAARFQVRRISAGQASPRAGRETWVKVVAVHEYRWQP